MNGTLPIDIDKYYVYKAQYPHLHHEMIHTEDWYLVMILIFGIFLFCTQIVIKVNNIWCEIVRN